VSDPSLNELKRGVERALDDLYRRDPDVLGTTERVLVGRLIVYLTEHLRPWLSQEFGDGKLVLDQEYERSGSVTKRLTQARDGALRRKITPDLILHRRHDNSARGNLLAIEVKARDSHDGYLHDRAKLAVLTGVANSARAYQGYLRLDGDKPRKPDDELQGLVGLPLDENDEAIHYYQHGLWMCLPSVDRNRARLEWFPAAGR
jgi:hypothetical protein